MYVTKTKLIIVLIILILIAAQSGAFADTHKVRAHPGSDGPTHPYYTTEDIERIHNNTVMVTVMIQEADGDTWYYVKDESTNGYYKALN